MIGDAFVGIDTACAKRKLGPVNVSVTCAHRFIPLPLRQADRLPPRGAGNVATLDNGWLTEFADTAAAYLRGVETRFSVRSRRIAIDAPAIRSRRGIASEGGGCPGCARD